VGQAGEIGHGLPGMRERAILAGGSLNAEAVGDRFIVSGRLPAITTSAIVRPEVPAQSGPTPGGPILGSKTLGPTGPGSTAATGTGAEV
jgi:hypothetical protein